MAPATVRASTIPQRVVGIPSPVVGAPVGIRAALVDMQEVVMEGVATTKTLLASGFSLLFLA